MSLRTGRLRQRVTLMRKTLVPAADGNGGFTEGWQAIGKPIAAEVVGINGREAVIAHALQGVSAFQITMRYRSDITPADQLLYKPKGAPEPMSLNVRSAADPDGRRTQLLILADTALAVATD